VRLCVPPDFVGWIEQLGFAVTPIGPELRATGKRPPARDPRQLLEETVTAQFETIASAARDCDAIVGATALQVAAPSIAASMRVPYMFAAYCPTVLPSRRHPPPVLAMLGETPAPPADDYSDLWDADARRWNATWAPFVDARRAVLGLPPVGDMRSYVHTDRPLLAADPALAPWPDAAARVVQTGAWILRDDRPLSPELRAFLEAGEPPVYVGFGSIRAPAELARTAIESARALGRRTIVSRGWAELALVDDAPDCLAIDDVSHQALFPRVAAVIHHGGAGTTTAVARAGAPQVVIPQHYDQHYWAARVRELAIGSTAPTIDSLTAALERALAAATRARDFASSIRGDGARIAAEHIARL
jgi:vancomycin aglycone glucosyltransferase